MTVKRSGFYRDRQRDADGIHRRPLLVGDAPYHCRNRKLAGLQLGESHCGAAAVGEESGQPAATPALILKRRCGSSGSCSTSATAATCFRFIGTLTKQLRQLQQYFGDENVPQGHLHAVALLFQGE